MILILGTPDEEHVEVIYEKLRQKGEESFCLDTRRFPYEVRVAYNTTESIEGYIYDVSNNRKIALSDIQSVYWRLFMGIVPRGIEDEFIMQMADLELKSAIGSLFRNMNCLWVNPPDTFEQHKYKAHQLRLLNMSGIRTPETLITNDGEELRHFYEKMNRKIIFKPVYGGAHTQVVTEDDFAPERLSHLANAPVQFQEFIPGMDIRAYVVGKSIFASEIQTDTVDFRNDPYAVLQPIELSDEVVNQCFTLLKTLNLVFSGIDIRRTPEGEYVFLEGNPSPMFKVFEERTGYPVSDRLVKLLLEHE